MALIDIIKKQMESTQAPVDPNKLNAQELQLVLQLLKESTIKGGQVETFYTLAVKLQNQFLEQSTQQ